MFDIAKGGPFRVRVWGCLEAALYKKVQNLPKLDEAIAREINTHDGLRFWQPASLGQCLRVESFRDWFKLS